jgi:GT2 family glycosyltransferase
MVLTYSLPESFRTNPRQTTATGRNLGIASAGGDVIVLVDGHTRVDKSFISASVKALQETGADCVGGSITTRGHGVVGRAIALAMASPFGVGDASFRTLANDADAKPVWTDSVAFGAYRREVFARLGGFAEDIDYGEDDEFNYRLRENGGRILLSPSIKATYYCRDSLGGLLRQYWRYGEAKAEVLQRHPHRLHARHLVPSALILTLTGGALLGIFQRRFAMLAVLAGGAYAAASALATLRIAREGNRQEARYLPLAFAAMHFGAGAGMLAGFWRILTGRGRTGHDRRD